MYRLSRTDPFFQRPLLNWRDQASKIIVRWIEETKKLVQNTSQLIFYIRGKHKKNQLMTTHCFCICYKKETTIISNLTWKGKCQLEVIGQSVPYLLMLRRIEQRIKTLQFNSRALRSLTPDHKRQVFIHMSTRLENNAFLKANASPISTGTHY